MRVLFAAGETRWTQWQPHLQAAFAEAGLAVDLVLEGDPAGIDAIIYAPGPGALADFTPYANCRLVQSLWAGVERIVGTPSLTQPLCRMVDPGLRQGMVEYVTGHVLRRHLGIDTALARQNGEWIFEPPPLASERVVAVLGLGELGAACAGTLSQLGFEVLGWSRRPKTLPGITCFDGEAGLEAVLRRAEIVVTLLPDTPATTNILDARRLAWLPEGAAIINPGRGTLIDDEALLAALSSGQVGQATLDVFRVEPLPPAHPYWAHPKVTVTPHLAAETRPSSASRVVAENLRRLAAGEPLLHLVDRGAGY